MNRRHSALFVALAVLALAVALPAIAAPPGQAQGPKASKEPKVQVTLNGTVEAATDAEGKTSYSLTSGGTTYALEAGPSWFHGDSHPLAAFVGDSVTIVGEHAEGSTEVDVRSVNGTELRAAGKPGWAGGWRQIGAKHPGWSQAKLDRFEARFGDCWPPGHCRDKTKNRDEVPAPTAVP